MSTPQDIGPGHPGLDIIVDQALGAPTDGASVTAADEALARAGLDEIHRERLQALAQEVSSNWIGVGNRPEILVVSGLQDPRVPASVHKRLAELEPASDSASAAKPLDPPRAIIIGDQILLLADRIDTQRECLRTIAHEAVGHWGLRRVHGTRLDDLLDRLATTNRLQVWRKARQYGLSMNDAAQRREAAEEVLAELAEEGRDPTLQEQLQARCRALVRQLCPSLSEAPFSQAELLSDFIAPARGVLYRRQELQERQDLQQAPAKEAAAGNSLSEQGQADKESVGKRPSRPWYSAMFSRAAQAPSLSEAGRASIQARARTLGLPATGPSAQIDRLVRIATGNPAGWTEEDFNLIAPHLSVHQDLRPGAEDRIDEILGNGLDKGMVDNVGNLARGDVWTWAKQLQGVPAYVFISGSLKYKSPGNPRLESGNKPLFVLRPAKGQAFYDALQTARLAGPSTAPESSKASQASQASQEDPTGADAFRSWFGNSQVVDEEGRPRVVYHGTNQAFERFDASRLGQNTRAASSIAFFFSESPSEAHEYANLAARTQLTNAVHIETQVDEIRKQLEAAEKRQDWAAAEALYQRWEEVELAEINEPPYGQNIVPAFLSISRPKILDMKHSFDGHVVAQAIQQAMEEGFDGLKLENVFDPVDMLLTEGQDRPSTTQWVAFRPEQIKSALSSRHSWADADRDMAGGQPLPAFSRKQDAGRPPRVATDATEDGLPEFAGRRVTIAFPQTTERFEIIPGQGQEVVNYAIMPSDGFDVLGHVELLVENGRPMSLLDIEVYEDKGRRRGIGRAVVETLLAANPEADLNISNIVPEARDFWGAMGVPQQNVEGAYDGTLTWQTYAANQRAARSDTQGRGTAGQAGAGQGSGSRQGASRQGEVAPAFRRRTDSEPLTKAPEDPASAVGQPRAAAQSQPDGSAIPSEADLETLLAIASRDPGSWSAQDLERIAPHLAVHQEAMALELGSTPPTPQDSAVENARRLRQQHERMREVMAKGLGKAQQFPYSHGLEDILQGRAMPMAPAPAYVTAAGDLAPAQDDLRPLFSMLPASATAAGLHAAGGEAARAQLLDALKEVDPTLTRSFQAWFQGSQIVDDEGEPLIVWHHGSFTDDGNFVPRTPMHFGTAAAARERAYGKLADEAAKLVTAYQNEQGVWHWHDGQGVTSEDWGRAGFADRQTAIDYGKSEAVKYAEDNEADASELGTFTSVWLSIKNPKRLPDLGGGDGEWEQAVEDAMAEGYDGIVYRNRFEDAGSDSYIAFYPDQIKSAEHNRGSFDPSDPDIRFNRAPFVNAKAFSNWFRDSKAVDDEGRPLVLYHGTQADFSEFRSSRGGEYGSGIYLTDDAGAAWMYAERASGGAQNVMPVYVRITNPYLATNRDEARALGVKKLRARGYDGIIATGPTGEKQYIVFSPEQVKSAIGNRGTFDADSPDIRFSRTDGASNAPATSGHLAFAQGNIDKLRVPEWKSREKLVELPIRDFLKLTKAGGSREKLVQAQDLLARGVPYSTLPFLQVDADGRVDGHEGRHRARALLAAGHQTMPVILRMAHLRWSEQKDPRLMDYREHWPQQLLAQAGAPDQSFTVPFPVRREQAMEAYAPANGAQASSKREDGLGAQAEQDDPSAQSALQRWLGDSKLLDGQGRPLVLYHGTDADFSVFDPQKSSPGAAFGPGIYLTTERENTRWKPGPGAQVMPLYAKASTILDLRAPLTPDAAERLQRIGLKSSRAGEPAPLWTMESRFGSVSDAAKEAGFDAVVHYGPAQKTHVLVFDPKQVKSAIGNRGAFDPSDPDIRFSRGTSTDQTQTPEFRRWFDDSKVADDQGEPLRVYHATRNDITEFRPGTWFAENVGLAEKFYNGPRGDRKGGNRTLYAAHLSIRKPADLRSLGIAKMVRLKDVAVALGIAPKKLEDAVKAAGKQKLDELRAKGGPSLWNMHDTGQYVSDGRPLSDEMLPSQYGTRLWEMIDRGALRLGLERLGYDGIVAREVLPASTPRGKDQEGDNWLPFKPEQIKSALGNSGAFSPDTADIRFSRAASGVPEEGGTQETPVSSPAPTPTGPVWRSELLAQIQRATLKKAPAQAWIDHLRGLVSRGVSPDEMEWTNVLPWLQRQQALDPSRRISRDEVATFIEDNAVQLQDVFLSEDRARALPQGWRLLRRDGADDEGDDAAPPSWMLLNEHGQEVSEGDTPEEAIEMAQDPDALQDDPQAPKFGKWTLPGGSDYREILITLARVPSALPPELAPALPPGYEVIFDSEQPESRRWGVTPPGQQHARPWAGRHDSPESARQAALAKYNAEALARWRDHVPSVRSAHWEGHHNIVAHLRTTARTDEAGRRVLMIEEIQSDWAQAARKARQEAIQEMARRRGISLAEAAALAPRDLGLAPRMPDTPLSDADHRRALYLQRQAKAGAVNTLSAEQQQELDDLLRRHARSLRSGGLVPHAPFIDQTEKWVALALRRAIRLAVDEGFDAIALVTGEQSAQRYDLRKSLSVVDVERYDLPGIGPVADVKLVDLEGKVIHAEDGAIPDRLAVLVGKDLAKDILAQASETRKRYEGSGLRFGGEGMKAFYDRIVPGALKSILQGIGEGQITAIRLQAGDDQGEVLSQPAVEVTTAMRQAAREGMPMFSRTGAFKADSHKHHKHHKYPEGLVNGPAVPTAIQPTTGPANEQAMRLLLADAGKCPMIGSERTMKSTPDGICRYDDGVGSVRYVYRRRGQALAALQVMTRDGISGLAANVYTDPAARRQGLAAELLRQAARDFKSLASQDISPDGAALLNGIGGLPGSDATKDRPAGLPDAAAPAPRPPLYHGTPLPLQELKILRAEERDRGAQYDHQGPAIYLTSDAKGYARFFARESGGLLALRLRAEGRAKESKDVQCGWGQVLTVEIAPEARVLRLEDASAHIRDLFSRSVGYNDVGEQLRQAVLDAGYDALDFREPNHPEGWWTQPGARTVAVYREGLTRVLAATPAEQLQPTQEDFDRGEADALASRLSRSAERGTPGCHAPPKAPTHVGSHSPVPSAVVHEFPAALSRRLRVWADLAEADRSRLREAHDRLDNPGEDPDADSGIEQCERTHLRMRAA